MLKVLIQSPKFVEEAAGFIPTLERHAIASADLGKWEEYFRIPHSLWPVNQFESWLFNMRSSWWANKLANCSVLLGLRPAKESFKLLSNWWFRKKLIMSRSIFLNQQTILKTIKAQNKHAYFKTSGVNFC